MKRLIADAAKMTEEQEELGVTVDGTSMSFDNVINAIDVMQEHLGIAGATAAEAKGTIEGSFNMMASSGKNLISALANPDADIGKLVGTFVESTATFASNLLPTIDNLITGIGEAMPAIGQAFSEHGPEMMEQGAQIIHHIYNGIMTALPQMAQAAPQVIGNLATGFISNAPALISSGVDLIVELINGFSRAVPMIISAAPLIISTLVDAIVSNAPKLLFAGFGLIAAVVDGLIGAFPTILAAGVQLVGTLLKGILGAVSSLILGGISMVMAVLDGGRRMVGNFVALANSSVGKLLQGILAGAGKLISSGVNMVKNVISGAKSAISGIASVGRDIVKGVWNGIKGAGGWIKGKVTGFFGDIVKAAKNKLKIASPSKVFRDEVGYFISLGVAAGIDKGKNKALKSADNLAKAVYKKSKEYADKTVKEQEYSLAQQLELWTTIQGQFIKSSQQFADAEKEISNIRVGIMEENKKLQDEYDKKFEERSNKIFNSFKLFDEVKESEEKVSGWDLVNNLRDQISAIESFYANLKELQERTGNTALVEQIKEMGVGAADQLQALLDMSDDKLLEYSGLFKDKQALANKLAGEELSGLYIETQTKITENNNALKGIFQKDAPSIGKALPDGMKAGILAGKSGVINAAISVARAAAKAAKQELGVASPSKVFKKIGGFMSEGMAVGFTDKIKDVTSRIKEAVSYMSGSVSNVPQLAVAGGGNTTSNFGGVYVTIEHMDGDKQSAETLAQEIEFLRRQQDESKGKKDK